MVEYFIAGYFGIAAAVTFGLTLSGHDECHEMPAAGIGVIWPLVIGVICIFVVVGGAALIAELPARAGGKVRNMLGKDA